MALTLIKQGATARVLRAWTALFLQGRRRKRASGVTVPAAPVATAVVLEIDTVQVSWTYSGPEVSGFRVYQHWAPDPTWHLMADVGPAVRTADDGSVVVGETYWYRVVAWNAFGETASADVSVTDN